MARTLLLAADTGNSILVELGGGEPNPVAYSAYGGQSAPRAIASHLGFNGELSERQIGWYLLGKGYRAYSPVLMRFLKPDRLSPFGKGGLNAYMYCGGDPLNFLDPTGQWRIPFFRPRRAVPPPPVPTRIPAVNNDYVTLPTARPSAALSASSTGAVQRPPSQPAQVGAVSYEGPPTSIAPTQRQPASFIQSTGSVPPLPPRSVSHQGRSVSHQGTGFMVVRQGSGASRTTEVRPAQIEIIFRPGPIDPNRPPLPAPRRIASNAERTYSVELNAEGKWVQNSRIMVDLVRRGPSGH
jgi:RHS repeat-associated protein